MRRRVSFWSVPSAIALPSRAAASAQGSGAPGERTIHPPPVDRARRIVFSTGSYSVARCGLLRLNRGVTKTPGCLTDTSSFAQFDATFRKKKKSAKKAKSAFLIRAPGQIRNL